MSDRQQWKGIRGAYNWKPSWHMIGSLKLVGSCINYRKNKGPYWLIAWWKRLLATKKEIITFHDIMHLRVPVRTLGVKAKNFMGCKAVEKTRLFWLYLTPCVASVQILGTFKIWLWVWDWVRAQHFGIIIVFDCLMEKTACYQERIYYFSWHYAFEGSCEDLQSQSQEFYGL